MNKIIVDSSKEIITILGVDFTFDCIIQLINNGSITYIIEEDGNFTVETKNELQTH